MDYAKVEASINTGNISTDDFLAVFTSGTTTTTAATLAAAAIGSTISSSSSSSSGTLNPPLVTVDGQVQLPNLLDLQSPVNDTIYLLNGSFYNNSLQLAGSYYNQTTGNQSSGLGGLLGNSSNATEVHWDGRYPSGYTLTHIVIASIIVTILMIIIVVGNMLVIIAIATEKSLKNIQNWFIASLAVADFFLGLIIMPFSLANELMGYWIFGSWWCDIHSAMDVLLCTASIMNLCLISLDRYWSITKAVDYLKSRTPARAAVMITAVWIMSALICIPPLLGWKVKMPEGDLPKCELSEDIGYVLYSALGSFYIPSCIMVFVYIRIYFAAKARARRGIKKHPRKTNNEQVTSFTTANKKGTIPMPSSSGATQLQLHQQRQIATIETPPNSATLPMQIPTVTMDLASDISTSEAGELEAVAAQAAALAYANPNQCLINANAAASAASSVPSSPKETLQVSTIATGRGVGLNVPVPPSMGSSNSINVLNNNNGSVATDVAVNTTGNATVANNNSGVASGGNAAVATSNELRVSPIAGRCRALSVGIDTDMVSEFDPSSSDSGVVSRCAVVKPLKFRLCQPIFGRKSNQQRRNESKAATVAAKNSAAAAAAKSKELAAKTELEPAIPKTPKPRDPEKEKRRIARKKEKRATLILGLIMGSFIACWLPFFFLYILVPACSSHCNIPESAFAIAFWLGYMNSALNPAIYTIFNKDFRRAFRRILFK
ncbi:alpha-2Db adrenergic receptor isoform X1 [Drosophila nasuta]|uniref:Alpha-2Db adrenergic receptor isoform X1 n=1 Tax=Drosophila albomicans TaxID=7291 RepID=A0A6P8XBR6_DROAB|nr:alpha-2Db adrenergic receptor isoform X1 [Drosophila albomicans]XP_060647814.1 alpha-2Db adrenergic receptor isoform X1 [Drosophila nasuta]